MRKTDATEREQGGEAEQRKAKRAERGCFLCAHVAERSPLGHLLKHWEGSRVVLEVLAQQLAVESLRVQRVVVARALGCWLVVSLPSDTPSSGSET